MRKLSPKVISRRGMASALAMVVALPALTQDNDCRLVDGRLPDACALENRDQTIVVAPGANTEQVASPLIGAEGFSISVDGEVLAGQKPEVLTGGMSPSVGQRGQDISLDAADVQVKFDGIRNDRRLNVQTVDLRSEFRAGERVTFRTFSNYTGWIARSEIRITRLRRGLGPSEVIVLPADASGQVLWTMPPGDVGEYSYTLRVYDRAGRFDETRPATLARREKPQLPELDGPVIAAGENEDRTARRTIPVTGGVVTVSGSGLPSGASVSVMGRTVPVDANGRFVTELIMPAGAQNIRVALAAPSSRDLILTREIDIPRDDWFATGLADLTFGKRGSSLGNADGFERGRLGFYAKGIVGGRTRITASVDTGEDDLDKLFNDFLTKNPRDVLDRLDPSLLYPTYGDDSTIAEDAPTRGKAYVKIEQDESHLVWGEFSNQIDNTAWLKSSRELYGAQGVYRSPATTVDGERRFSATLYAANPDSLPQRDVLRGTGGSIYLLKRQDVVPGSETVTLEVSDPVTGRMIRQETLKLGADYRIDTFSGTVILTRPLSGTGSGAGLIGTGASGSYDVDLIVQYEYVPVFGSTDGAAMGGRIEGWLPGDMVRLGVTAMDENTGTANMRALAADVHIRFTKDSFIEGEVAESRGEGYGRSISTDGGLTYIDITPGASAGRPQARRLQAEAALGDLIPGAEGHLFAYYTSKDKGFQTLSEDVYHDERLFGFGVEAQLSPLTGLRLAHENFRSDDGDRRTFTEAQIGYQLRPDTRLDFGLLSLDQHEVGDPDDSGKRTDAVLRLTRELGADQTVWIFGQGTLQRSGTIRRNDRFGIGGVFNLSQRLTFEGEISDGTNGHGGRAILNYRPNDTESYYLGYRLEPNRELDSRNLVGRDGGTLVLGAERRVNDRVSYFGENTYDLFGNYRSLNSTYGVTYTPNSVWSFTGGLDLGKVRDVVNGDYDRIGVSLGGRYTTETDKLALRFEYIEDQHDTDASRNRKSYAVVANYTRQVSPDWRFLASLDALVSESQQSDYLDGRYVEASIGYAYRPVDNDRLNLLARYTVLYDLPGVDQVTHVGTTDGDKQRSQIFSLDAIYELNAAWEIGGKLAYRKSEIAARTSTTFTSNDAGMIAVRATYSLNHFWEVSAEARMLYLPDAKRRETGALLSVHRSIGNHAKIGMGYNFGNFSDDLRNTKLDDKGVFVNLQMKF